MTMPSERTRALLQTWEFLRELRSPEATPGVPDEIRRQAHVLLRHFPEPWQLHSMSRKLPEMLGPVDGLGK